MAKVISKIWSSMINNKTAWIVSSLFIVVLIVFIVTPFVWVVPAIFFYCMLASMCVLGIFLTCLFCLRLWNSEASEGEVFIDLESVMLRKFSAKDLESATRNFCKELGKGAFGAVFEGSLDNGTRVAVKRLDQSSHQGIKEFSAEVKTIGSLHHLNLVKLVGFCAENSHKLLVYEFMSNGSLDKLIFNQSQESPLDWPTRSEIILHIAKGLSYLHEECFPRVIHLDLKSSNVLLDGEFNAKLSDFGLAWFTDRDESQIQTTVRGTRGYMAPEWFTNRGISEKVDIYSFGIVVLEILCGKKNFDHSRPEEDETLLHLVRRKGENDQLYDVIDTLNEDMMHDKEAVVKMMKLAILCLMDDSRRRPSMSTVVKVLEHGLDIEDIVEDPMEVRVDVSEASSILQTAEVLSGPR